MGPELLVLQNVLYLSDDALPMHLPRIWIGKRDQNRLSLYVSKMSMDGRSKVEPWVLVLLMTYSMNGPVEQTAVLSPPLLFVIQIIYPSLPKF